MRERNQLGQFIKGHLPNQTSFLKGHIPWMKGKHHSGGAKRKQSLAHRKYYLDEQFFEKWSGKMAWVLGFIIADGCIRKDEGKLQISSCDEEVLIKIKQALQAKHPIKAKRNKGSYSDSPKTIYFLGIGSTKICSDLIRLGVTPNKSKIIQFPKVPRKYLNHFIRGLIDGDGSLYTPRKKNGSVTTEIGTASKIFADSLKNKVENNGFKVYLEQFRNKEFWRIRCHERTFLPWIYKNKGNYYLSRKYQKYTAYLN